jgi:hypothetical protein
VPRLPLAILLCALVAAPPHPAPAQQPSTSGQDEFYSNGTPPNTSPAPGGGPMYGNGQYGRDPQCGGTDRSYYDRLYNSHAMVVDIPTMQRLYRATGGQIWIRCGACRDQAICWPRPGFDQLLAQAQQSPSPPPPAQAVPNPMPWEQPAQAAEPPGAVQQTVADIQQQWATKPPLKAGVSYASTSFNGQPLHAVKVAGPMTIGFNPNGAPLQSLVGQTGNGVTGGVTGTFSDWPHKPPGVGGPVVQGGKMVAPPPGKVGVAPNVPRSFLGYRRNPSGYFVTEVPALENRGASLGPYVESLGADQGLGGLARLLDHGQDVHRSQALGSERFSGAQVSDGPNARAVAGVTADGRSLMLLVEEGSSTAGKGAGAGQMGNLLKGLGASDAVIMDSGGSAQIYIPGVSGANNHPNDARALPTGILF